MRNHASMMKKSIICMFTTVALILGAAATVQSDSGASTINALVSVGEKSYNLSSIDDAKDYIGNYADNIQEDKEFKSHEGEALATIRQENHFFGSWLAILPPLIAIFLALITKEVYSSLFVGILTGGLLYSSFCFEGTMNHVFIDGFIKSIADPYNIGILFFLVLLGSLVAMMNKTGASAAFGRWAATHIKSRVGAQVTTIILGMLIFVDDYFNCLTVGSVMRPVTDAKRVSRAKLAYLIDSTAAPICIIAPISSWAAAVAGFAKGAGADSGFSLFINAIPYNFYALLTIVMMFFIAFSKFDFGLMRKHERNAENGDIFTTGEIAEVADVLQKNDRGRVCDLIVPVIVLVSTCIIGMIYSGGFFSKDSEAYRNFITAFSNSDASVGLVLGSSIALVFAVIFYTVRRVISFKDCMEAFPDGFKAMVPAIMILCCAWTLKGMTDSLGAKVFISDLINGPAASLHAFLPAIFFLIAVVLAFSTGTSWGTFGILIPICLSAMPAGEMTIVAVSACMAGAVCGDHCSPISDTTIMASAGAQCNHINHVNTQLPYSLSCVVISFIGYIIAGFIPNWHIDLPIVVALMIIMLFLMKLLLGERAESIVLSDTITASVSAKALSKVMRTMGKEVLFDNRIDKAEAKRLLEVVRGLDDEDAVKFTKALEDALEDGVITGEESDALKKLLKMIAK